MNEHIHIWERVLVAHNNLTKQSSGVREMASGSFKKLLLSYVSLIFLFHVTYQSLHIRPMISCENFCEFFESVDLIILPLEHCWGTQCPLTLSTLHIKYRRTQVSEVNSYGYLQLLCVLPVISWLRFSKLVKMRQLMDKRGRLFC